MEVGDLVFTWLKDRGSERQGHMALAGQDWLETMKGQPNLLGEMTLKGVKLLPIEAIRWESYIFMHLRIGN